MGALDDARLALVSISFVITLLILFMAADLYFYRRSQFNTVVLATYCFGVASSTAKLYFEAGHPFTDHLGECAIATAMAMHESLVIYRFTILSANKFRKTQWRVAVWISIWLLWLYRIIAEFLDDTPGRINYPKLGASYLFYGYIAIMDIIVSSISLRIIYEIKKSLLIGNVDQKALSLVHSVQRLIGSEVGIGVFSLIINLPVLDFSDGTLAGNLSKPATDLCIYVSGYCALVYSASLMKLITLNPSVKNDIFSQSIHTKGKHASVKKLPVVQSSEMND